jgi:hypothetical protein
VARIMGRGAIVLLAAALAGVVSPAQVPGQASRWFDPFRDSPFPAPSTAADAFDEAAWACEQLAAQPGDVEAAIAALRRTLARVRDRGGGGAVRALPHVYAALERLGASLRVDELGAPPEGPTRAIWRALLVRARGADALLFREFHACEEGSLDREALGDALARRHNRAFAAEVAGAVRPVLHVAIGPREDLSPPSSPAAAKAGVDGDFPPLPVPIWRRDEHGYLQLADGRGGAVVLSTDPRLYERAQLRWLGELAAEPAAQRFALLFDLQLQVVRFGDVDTAKRLLAVRVQEARQLADERLHAAFAAIAARGLIPAAWATRVPTLVVRVRDNREPAVRAAAPLPDFGRDIVVDAAK